MTDSLEIVFAETTKALKDFFINFVNSKKATKLDIGVLCTLYKLSEPHVKMTKLFRKENSEPVRVIQTPDDVDEKMESDSMMIKQTIDRYNEMASNWILESIDFVKYDCSEIESVVGASGEKCMLPKPIARSRVCINFSSPTENECFKYAVLIGTYHENFRHPERTAQYMQYMDRFDYSDLVFPVSSLAIQKFEKRNTFLSVFAHVY